MRTTIQIGVTIEKGLHEQARAFMAARGMTKLSQLVGMALSDYLATPGQHEKQMEDAIAISRQAGHASVSLLQRRMRVSYATALALVEEMQERGFVTPGIAQNHGDPPFPK